MNEDREARLFWIAAGGLVPVVVAATLVALRDTMVSTNVALVLVTVVVVVAVAGGPKAGATAAVSAALSFEFFHTRPYLHLRIASGDDIETTVLLLVVGLIVGHVAANGRRARSSADASHREIKRLHRVAELGARGEDPSGVIRAAEDELSALLHLRGCRFEAPPFASSLERLERSGALPPHLFRLQKGGFELPREGIALPVLGRGQLLGRFVLDPTPETPAPLARRVVAVAIADEVGAVLAAPRAHGNQEEQPG